MRWKTGGKEEREEEEIKGKSRKRKMERERGRGRGQERKGGVMNEWRDGKEKKSVKGQKVGEMI